MPCKNMVKCEIPVNLRWVWYLWGKMDISNIYLIVLYSFMSWSVGCGQGGDRREAQGNKVETQEVLEMQAGCTMQGFMRPQDGREARDTSGGRGSMGRARHLRVNSLGLGSWNHSGGLWELRWSLFA